MRVHVQETKKADSLLRTMWHDFSLYSWFKFKVNTPNSIYTTTRNENLQKKNVGAKRNISHINPHIKTTAFAAHFILGGSLRNSRSAAAAP